MPPLSGCAQNVTFSLKDIYLRFLSLNLIPVFGNLRHKLNKEKDLASCAPVNKYARLERLLHKDQIIIAFSNYGFSFLGAITGRTKTIALTINSWPPASLNVQILSFSGSAQAVWDLRLAVNKQNPLLPCGPKRGEPNQVEQVD